MMSHQFENYRAAAVAGQFYPADPEQLAGMLQQLLKQAPDAAFVPIKALIAPHAGFIYSGPVAASIFRQIQAQASGIDRVVLLGPSHHVGFNGVAMSSADCFSTPLGNIAIDKQAQHAIACLPQVVELDQAHAREHSLEVQLPFLQTILPDFRLVPLVVGECAPAEVAEVLERLWGGPETLIVVSSDLSHFHSYDEARARDQRTSRAILDLQPQHIDYGDACGRNPVNGLLLAARTHGLVPELVDLRNSGDTAGGKDRVVGYGAYRFLEHD